MEITALLKKELDMPLCSDPQATEEEKIEVLMNIDIRKQVVFNFPLGYNYDLGTNENYEVIATENRHDESDTVYYTIDEIFYTNGATTSRIKKIKLTESEMKTFYKKYNFNDFLAEGEQLFLIN